MRGQRKATIDHFVTGRSSVSGIAGEPTPSSFKPKKGADDADREYQQGAFNSERTRWTKGALASV